MPKALDHSVVQRLSQPPIRPPLGTCGQRPNPKNMGRRSRDLRHRNTGCGPRSGPTPFSTSKTATIGNLRTTTKFQEHWSPQSRSSVTGTPAADHGVVRDYGAAFIDMSRLRARHRFASGLAKVVDHSVVQRLSQPTKRPPMGTCGQRPNPKNMGRRSRDPSSPEHRLWTTEWSATMAQRSLT
jgi:hypothetical protein